MTATTQTPVNALMALVEEYSKRARAPLTQESVERAVETWNAVEASVRALAAIPEGFVDLTAFDKAVAEELPRVSHLEYDSHEICKHFAGKLRDRLAALRASSPADTRQPMSVDQIHDEVGHMDANRRDLFGKGVRFAESYHGIVTKESI